MREGINWTDSEKREAHISHPFPPANQLDSSGIIVAIATFVIYPTRHLSQDMSKRVKDYTTVMWSPSNLPGVTLRLASWLETEKWASPRIFVVTIEDGTYRDGRKPTLAQALQELIDKKVLDVSSIT